MKEFCSSAPYEEVSVRMILSSFTLILSFKLHFLLLRFGDVALGVKDNYG